MLLPSLPSPTAKERAKLIWGLWPQISICEAGNPSIDIQMETVNELLSNCGPCESGVGLVSLLDQLSLRSQRKGTSTGENNGKLYWHKSQGLKWGKAKLEVYREKTN